MENTEKLTKMLKGAPPVTLQVAIIIALLMMAYYLYERTSLGGAVDNKQIETRMDQLECQMKSIDEYLATMKED